MPVFVGTSGNDNVPASLGFDTLYGLDGNDTLGSSIVGFDYWEGGQGNDLLFAQWGSPAFGDFYGGDGNDLIQLGNFSTVANHAYGGDGNDTIQSAAFFGLTDNSQDYLDGGAGNDLIEASNGNSTIVGGTGTDTIFTDGGSDLVWGVEGQNDQIVGGSGNNTIFAGGNGSSVTQVTGGTGNDTINGQLDEGILYVTPGTGSGLNVVTGDDFSNHIYGNHTTGSLWMRGGIGQDEMVGGTGDNHFIGEGGGDFMTGGGTSNAFLFNSVAEGSDHINNFNTSTDVIGVYAGGFSGLFGGETLTAGVNLINGATPVANVATFLYDNTVGALYFDADGTGSASSPVLIAGLVNKPASLAPSNFFISGSAF